MTTALNAESGRVRSGRVPMYVARLADTCSCMRRVTSGEKAVWVRYRANYAPLERCGHCAQALAWLKGRMYAHWLGQEGLGNGDAYEAARFEPFWQKRRAEILTHPADHAGVFVTFCAYHYGQAAGVKLHTPVRYKLFHPGCRVREVITEPALRDTVIKAMRRLQEQTEKEAA